MQGMILPIETPTSKLMTTEEAAEFLSLSSHSIHKYVQRRLLKPEMTVGSAYLFSAAECERFQRERKPRGNPTFRRKQH